MEGIGSGRIDLHIFQGMDAHYPVQSKPSMNFISFEAVETSVYIDIHPIILYVFDIFDISEFHKDSNIQGEKEWQRMKIP